MGVYNEYSQLREVILGISGKIFIADKIPPEVEKELSLAKKQAFKMAYRVFKKKPLPKFFTKRISNELEGFLSVLNNHGVVVHRLEPILPLQDEPEGLSQMFARDPGMTVGDQFFFGSARTAARNKEKRGYTNLLAKIGQAGLKISKIEDEAGVFLEGGDVIIDYPYIYVGMKKRATNLAGLEWLTEKVGTEFKVIPVDVIDPRIQHLDCCMTVVGPNIVVINRESLRDPLPDPLRSYTRIEVDAKTRQQLGTNVFVINRETIVVQKRHRDLQQKLSSHGFNVIQLEFSAHARFQGGFRCTTCPINRAD